MLPNQGGGPMACLKENDLTRLLDLARAQKRQGMALQVTVDALIMRIDHLNKRVYELERALASRSPVEYPEADCSLAASAAGEKSSPRLRIVTAGANRR